MKRLFVMTLLMLAACGEPAPRTTPGDRLAGDAVKEADPTADIETVAVTREGPVRGVLLDDRSVRFHGIPFAAPPVGDLRWRPPQPPASRDGILPAARPHAACAQADLGWNDADRENMAEDCLYLSIRTPGLGANELMPVMVFIHGGANLGGRGNWAVDGRLHEAGIVVVSIQYRLGALGFMAHPSLTAEGDTGASGNYALMDQAAALDWISDNIAAFGGDPDRVTLFGSSAGSQGVALQMMSPLSDGLFQRAIMQSGSAGFGLPPRSLAEGETLGMNIAEAAGLPRAASAADLRALGLDDLFAAQWEAEPVAGVNAFEMFMAPLVDGHALPVAPLEAARSGAAFPVPFIIGTSAMEYNYLDAESIGPAIDRVFGEKAQDARAFYGLDNGEMPSPDPRLGDVLMQASTDMSYRCPAVLTARLAAASGATLWQFVNDHDGADGPVSHAGENDYVFSFEESDTMPIDRYWTAFARTGDPNGGDQGEGDTSGGLPDWPQYDAKERAYLVFTNEGPRTRYRLREPLCDWLDRL